MSYSKELEFCRTLFLEQNFSSQWIEKTQILEKIDEIEANMVRDLMKMEDNASFIFKTNQQSNNHTKQTIELFRDWTVSGECPSLVAICQFMIQNTGIENPDLKKMMFITGVLGELDNPLPYHNNMHFRKVAFQCMRMICVYNDIYKDTSREFKDKQIAVLLATACIHDFGHDGKGNTLKGVYIPHRLEQNSYDIVRPVLEAAGIQDKDVLHLMHVMLLCTDVTPFNDPGNAVNQAKAAYRYHFLGGRAHMMEGLNLDKELSIMEKSPAAAAMALMIHEADIATSAGLHYDITKYETGLFMSEVADGVATPQHVLDFLNNICNRQMLSEVGQQLFAANLARIYALAEDDCNEGNEPFPAVDQSDFVRGIHSKDYQQGTKSIN